MKRYAIPSATSEHKINPKHQEYSTTPIRIRITSALHMFESIRCICMAKNQFYNGRFVNQVCYGSGAWYADKIGSEWEVLPVSEQVFRVNNAVGCGFFFIDKRDCTTL